MTGLRRGGPGSGTRRLLHVVTVPDSLLFFDGQLLDRVPVAEVRHRFHTGKEVRLVPWEEVSGGELCLYVYQGEGSFQQVAIKRIR